MLKLRVCFPSDEVRSGMVVSIFHFKRKNLPLGQVFRIKKGPDYFSMTSFLLLIPLSFLILRK